MGWIGVELIDGAAHYFGCGEPWDGLADEVLVPGEELEAGLVDVGDGQSWARQHEHIGAGIHGGMQGFCECGGDIAHGHDQKARLPGGIVFQPATGKQHWDTMSIPVDELLFITYNLTTHGTCDAMLILGEKLWRRELLPVHLHERGLFIAQQGGQGPG